MRQFLVIHNVLPMTCLANWKNPPGCVAGFFMLNFSNIFADAGLRGSCILLKSSSGCYMMPKT